jgi:YfiH family protein
MGFGVNENKTIVKENHNLVKKIFNIEKLARVNQVHGIKIKTVDNENFKNIDEADGLFTCEKNLALGIMTADCYTVQMIGEKAIANLHCGWRSIYGEILNNAVTLFDKYNDKIKQAIIGVGICYNCYEVDEELANKFAEKFKVEIFKKNNKYFLDLRSILVKNLLSLNISNILHIKYCSKCSSFLYSHRRDKGKTGRMISVLMKYD